MQLLDAGQNCAGKRFRAIFVDQHGIAAADRTNALKPHSRDQVEGHSCPERPLFITVDRKDVAFVPARWKSYSYPVRNAPALPVTDVCVVDDRIRASASGRDRNSSYPRIGLEKGCSTADRPVT